MGFKTNLQCGFCFNETFYSCRQSASHLSLRLSLHPPLRFRYLKRFKAPTKRLVVSPDTRLPQTCHKWNNWILSGGIYYEERSCAGRGIDIKELRGRKWLRAGQIVQARWESQSGHCVFESSSWDPDDRVVFWNLRAKAQKWAFPPVEEWARKEGFGFQSIHSFIYITYFHRHDSFKGKRGLFSDFQYTLASVFYFPTLSPTMHLFPEQCSPEVCVEGLCLLLKDTFRVLLNVERGMGGCMIVLSHLFSSGGLHLGTNS